MLALSTTAGRLPRRSVLAAASTGAALAAAGSWLPVSWAAELGTPEPFSFDTLTAAMRAAAAGPWAEPARDEGFFSTLDYDRHRLIRFRADRTVWPGDDGLFGAQAFPMGWLFREGVALSLVDGGMARPVTFAIDDFEFLNGFDAEVPADLALPGIAGFRLVHPLNRPDVMDELVTFLGASYFRALGRGNGYGISARGLAVNTATSDVEEFPRFAHFYLERTAPGAAEIVVHAALDGPSVTGAFRFVIRPGANTVMDVTARLFFRADVAQLGVAPLTSMFLFAEKNRAAFDDYRPNVHDSNGLGMVRSNGEVVWRPLNNPPVLAGSYFVESTPRSFGLYQRDRSFASFEDPEARYERRPSLMVEPLGDWGRGALRLVEIPTAREINDNIVAFWVPEVPARAGEEREYAYRLTWGDLPPDPKGTLAWVDETRSGAAGVAGAEPEPGTRKFVIDFRGGTLAALDGDAPVSAVTNVMNGAITTTVLLRIPDTDVWRLVLDVAADDGATVELGAHLAGFGRRLSETWLYQWINDR